MRQEEFDVLILDWNLPDLKFEPVLLSHNPNSQRIT